MDKTFHITTFGCQMNEHDSEIMAGMLTEMGYTEGAERRDADLEIINPCSIRDNADKRFFSTFSDRGRLKKMQNMSSDQIKEKYSFNTFVVAMLVQSTFGAGKRLKKKLTDEIDVNDPKVREEMKKIFRELCFLNGINPENMADIDNTSALG